MVFKIVSGVDRLVWDVYNSDQTSAEFVTAALDVTNQHQDHYKNRVVMNWQTFNSFQVKKENHNYALDHSGIKNDFLKELHM